MIILKRTKKRRSKNTLFNPYQNGISSYDMAYLSSRKDLFVDKIATIKDTPKKDTLAA